MKKMLSVLLALALCCALLPAVAEQADLTGTWYISRATAGGTDIDVVDPKAITLTLEENGVFSMATVSFTEPQAGTWTLEDGAVNLTVDEQTTPFRIEGDELVYEMGESVVYLAKTPAEAVPLPVYAPAESVDDFNGKWMPSAQVSMGLYMPVGAGSDLTYLDVKDGVIHMMLPQEDGTAIEAGTYECKFEDGMMTAEDDSFGHVEMTITLREDGSLFFDSLMSMNGQAIMEITAIYTRETSE